MVLSRRNVKYAKKSVIALLHKNIFIGSSIDNTSSSNPVYTSVNQCNLNGSIEVYFSDGSHKAINLGEAITSDKIMKVIHDGLCYSFPSSQRVTVQAMVQTGSWREINKSGRGDVISAEVFSVWIEHAKGNTLYFYYEIADTDGETLAPKTVSVYDSQAHVVTNMDKRSVSAAIFTESGYDIELSTVKFRVLNSLAVIASVREDGQLKITLADLTQKKTKADLLFTWGEKTSLRSFSLPEGEDRGKSITYLVSPVTNDSK